MALAKSIVVGITGPPRALRRANSCPNIRLNMTGASPLATAPSPHLVATRDPFDSAHSSFAVDGRLRPAAIAAPGGGFTRILGTPRRYHPSYITSSGYSTDSALGFAAERAARLGGDFAERPASSRVASAAALAGDRLPRLIGAPPESFGARPSGLAHGDRRPLAEVAHDRRVAAFLASQETKERQA